MDKVEDAKAIVERFLQQDEQLITDLVTALREARVALDKNSRIDEVQRMIKYHQVAADQAGEDGNEDEKNHHLADIIVLAARISYLESSRENSPVTGV